MSCYRPREFKLHNLLFVICLLPGSVTAPALPYILTNVLNTSFPLVLVLTSSLVSHLCHVGVLYSSAAFKAFVCSVPSTLFVFSMLP